MKLFLVILISFISNSLLSQNNEQVISPLPIHNASSFMENKGQWDEDILFKSSFKGGNLWVQQNKLLFHLQDFRRLRNSHGKISITDTNIRDLDHLLYVSFKNSLNVKTIQKLNTSKEYYNFFIGNDKNKWASDVHAYTSVELSEIYKGINLRLIQEDEQLKYEFIVAPTVNPNQIELEIFGANSKYIDRNGHLHLSTPLGEIIEKKPYVYQIVNHEKVEVDSRFQLKNGIISFQLGEYDNSKVLVIDPILVFATYNGAYSDNFGMTATYGQDGSAYSGGTVFGSSYPTIDPAVVFTKTNLSAINYNYTVHACSDIFISKYSADGSKMLWSTFLGGGDYTKGAETVHSLICDKDNNIFGFGATSSTDFPVTSGCFQNVHKGGSKINIGTNGAFFGDQGTDLFSFKISSNGHQLLGSSYIGGSSNDGLNYNYMGQIVDYERNVTKINNKNYLFVPYDSLTSNYGDQFRGEIFLDSSNNILIASSSRSSDFPTLNAIQSTIGGKQDGVIFKLSKDFKTLIFSTFLGGDENDAINSIKISKGNEIIFCGGTSSSNLYTSNNAYQKNHAGGKADGFIGKLDYDGKKLVQLSYLGENLFDQVFIIESDYQNNIYVIGHSIGGNFPVVNAPYSIPKSTQFIAKFDPSLTQLLNSTVYGNGDSKTSNISPAAFLVDDCNNIYVSGWGANIIQYGAEYLTGTWNSQMYLVPGSLLDNMPISSDAFLKTTDHYDFHLFVLDKTFSKLVYGSYLGGNLSQEHVDGGTSRFDKKGIVYQSVCGGCGQNSDFPVTPNAWSKTNNSNNCNNLVFKFDFELVPSAKLTSSSDTSCLPSIITYTNTSNNIDKFMWDFGNGQKDSTSMSISKSYLKKGNYKVKLLVKNNICNLVDTTSFTSTILDTIRYSKIKDIEHCNPTTTDFKANSYGTANQYTWSFHKNFSPIIQNSIDSSVTVFSDSSKWLYYKVNNGYCPKKDSLFIHIISSSLKIVGDTTICIHQTDSLYSSIQSKTQTFTFDWSPTKFIQSYPSSNSVILKMDTTQTIYLQANGNLGCVVKDSIKVSFKSWNLQKILASADKTNIIKGENVQLYGKPDGYSYLWSPIDKVINSQTQNTEATIWGNTIFNLNVSDGQCAINDTILIKVIPWNCDFPYVFVPNAFSPNNDGENDVLYVRGHPIKSIEFRVFNRWGEMVFESRDISIGWDGTYKGKLVNPDVFDYYLNVECVGDEHKQLQGNVTVLR